VPAVDLEAELTTWVRNTFDVNSCTELPPDLTSVLPVVQVEIIGGFGGPFGDSPRVEIDVYAGSYEAAKDLAYVVHEALTILHGTVGQAVITAVRCDSVPARRPYDTTSGLRRVGASYTVSAHPNSYA
jgi:hypothetical protein